MSIDIYTHGDWFVAVETGMPQDSVRIGYGATEKEAIESLEGTAMQSVGRDSGARKAIEWAAGAGWFGDGDSEEIASEIEFDHSVEDEDDDEDEDDEDEDEDDEDEEVIRDAADR